MQAICAATFTHDETRDASGAIGARGTYGAAGTYGTRGAYAGATREAVAIRAFIGIDFDDWLKKQICELQQRIRKYAVQGRWKYIANFHLTLKFLSEIDTNQKSQIDETMLAICTGQTPIRLSIENIGIFEGKDAARVLWLGLAGDLEALRRLAGMIDDAVRPLGVQQEKKSYTPHITIGQDIKFGRPFEQVSSLVGPVKLGSVKVDRLFLFKSEQISDKRVYTKISEYRFKMPNSR